VTAGLPSFETRIFIRLPGNGAIAPLPGSLMKMRVSKDGKPAVTHYQVQKQYMEAALVRLTLETG